MNSELEPCPKCGCIPVATPNDCDDSVTVSCPNCGLELVIEDCLPFNELYEFGWYAFAKTYGRGE